MDNIKVGDIFTHRHHRRSMVITGLFQNCGDDYAYILWDGGAATTYRVGAIYKDFDYAGYMQDVGVILQKLYGWTLG